MSVAVLSYLSVTDATQHHKLPANFASTILLLPTILRIFEEITTASSLNNHNARLYGLMQILSLGRDLMDTRLKPRVLNLPRGANICVDSYKRAL